ncbi:hypothetical protein [Candidatus Brocadia sinica]|uniref:hypothetical protein n=1 Tax=Candidatus Brocadia sinica TaxID=795830 RepID=UPI001E2C3395|nr:hypothetical protein [Candidatus Brocadia sinica]GJQ19625.1 MAG: hypothetical protein HBSIN01_35840 [Candidatus Brocadia sinica]
MKVYGIAAVKYEPKPPVGELHISYQRIRLINEMSFPFWFIYPTQLPLGEDTKAKRMPCGMVLLTDIGKVDVTQLIGGVEHHLQ